MKTKQTKTYHEFNSEKALKDLPTDIRLCEPIRQYQNTIKPQGVEELTPERAMIVELVRCYLLLGVECSLLEVQKLAWFLERAIIFHNLPNRLHFAFKAHNYGPFSNNLRHFLSSLDGTYLDASKRISDSAPFDTVDFIDANKKTVERYLNSNAKQFLPALKTATNLIEGFESPYGMELLTTVDWLIAREGCQPTLESIKKGVKKWPAGVEWAERKQRIFDDRSLTMALKQLSCLY